MGSVKELVLIPSTRDLAKKRSLGCGSHKRTCKKRRLLRDPKMPSPHTSGSRSTAHQPKVSEKKQGLEKSRGEGRATGSQASWPQKAPTARRKTGGTGAVRKRIINKEHQFATITERAKKSRTKDGKNRTLRRGPAEKTTTGEDP